MCDSTRADHPWRQKNILRRGDARETTLNRGFKWRRLAAVGLPATRRTCTPGCRCAPAVAIKGQGECLRTPSSTAEDERSIASTPSDENPFVGMAHKRLACALHTKRRVVCGCCADRRGSDFRQPRRSQNIGRFGVVVARAMTVIAWRRCCRPARQRLSEAASRTDCPGADAGHRACGKARGRVGLRHRATVAVRVRS